MAALQTPKGTYDILPDDWPYWRLVTATAERVARRYGYRRIDTPTFEATELFARTSGEGSDVVSKEMYTFDDKAGRSLTLRPEGTAPVVRIPSTMSEWRVEKCSISSASNRRTSATGMPSRYPRVPA